MSEISDYWQEAMRRRLSRRALLRTGALAGIGLATGSSILGCGGQPKPSTGLSGDEQPQYGGIFTFPMTGDPPNFDLISNSTYYVLHPLAPVYNNLVMFDPMEPDKIIGDLAEKWEVSADGKVYTFSLIKGVKFHDGKPCTSADVKYTFDIVRDPPKGLVSPRKGSLAVVDGIEAPDDHTVRFVLKRPSPSLLTNLAQGWMGVFPKHILQEKGNMQKDAIGTGPFKLKEYVRGVSIELERNPDYHVKGRPYLEGIKVFIIPDAGTSFANFRTAQLLMRGLSVEDAETAEKEFGDRIYLQRVPSYTYNTVAFGTKSKPWNDVLVRQAISLAIDRAEAIKVLANGNADIGGYMPPSGVWAVPPADLEKIAGYGKDTDSVAAAKKLLAEAGYPSGFSTTLLTRKGWEDLSIFVKDQLSKAGIDAKLDIRESAAAYESVDKRAFDLLPWQHSIAVDDPDGVFAEFYTCAAARNYSDICSKEVDDLFDKQSQTLNVEERKKLVQQTERSAMLTYNRVILYWSRQIYGFSRRVHNYKKHPSLYNNQRLQDVWLSK